MDSIRVLVVIANYGHQNAAYLSLVLDELRRLPFDITIEILSESPKDFGSDIRVRVGLPGKSPWTLPFGYKQSFLERQDDFDLYIYSEDDILIKERNIRAFIEMTSILPQELIAGFTRYELDDAENVYYIDMFRAFHFVPRNTVRHGGHVFAELTNEHSGCFMLTRQQLNRVLACPDFFQQPRKGLYGLPETAATEPYTQCGLRKVICLSRFSDFTLHHLPNKYWKRATHKLATTDVIEAQRRSIVEPSLALDAQLLPTRMKVDSFLWDKAYYTPVDQEVVDQILPSSRAVLSIGCGVGATELALSGRGHSVSAIPLDAVIASYAAENGVRMLPPNLTEAFTQLRGSTFNAVLLLDVLQYAEDPIELLRLCDSVMLKGGLLIVRAPNLLHTNLVRQVLEKNVTLRDVMKLASYRSSGLHATSKNRVKKWLRASGFTCKKFVRFSGEGLRKLRLGKGWRRLLPDFVATREFLVVAEKG